MIKKNITKINTYQWIGMNHLGNLLKGEEQAKNALVVSIKLKQQGIKPVRIYKKFAVLQLFQSKKIKAKHIHDFSQKLTTLLTAQISLATALDIISQGQSHQQLRELILDVKIQLESGTSLAMALEKYPHYFSNFYCKLIHAGEQSGQLQDAFKQIINYQEKMFALKNSIKQALFYPSIVLIVALILCFALLIFVVPQFQTLFQGLGAQLPFLTRNVIYFSETIQSHLWFIIFCFILFVLIVKFIHKFPDAFKKKLDYLSLVIPVIGKLKKAIIIARLTRTLAMTLRSGLPISQSLQISTDTTDNYIYQQGMQAIQEKVRAGYPLYDAFRQTQLFPDQILQMLAIGEESSNLQDMLTCVADSHDAQIQQTANYIGRMTEPVIMLILGMLVGLLIMAMYLPIFKLGTVL